jgi:hypothetical protein
LALGRDTHQWAHLANGAVMTQACDSVTTQAPSLTAAASCTSLVFVASDASLQQLTDSVICTSMFIDLPGKDSSSRWAPSTVLRL